MAKIIVQNTEVTVLSHNDKDYISLTEMRWTHWHRTLIDFIDRFYRFQREQTERARKQQPNNGMRIKHASQ